MTETVFQNRLRYLVDVEKTRNHKSKSDIAMGIGITDRALDHYLKGTRKNPHADTLMEICRYFKVTPEWLYGMEYVERGNAAE